MSDRYTTEDVILETLENIEAKLPDNSDHQHSYIVVEWEIQPSHDTTEYHKELNAIEYKERHNERRIAERLMCSQCLEERTL